MGVGEEGDLTGFPNLCSTTKPIILIVIKKEERQNTLTQSICKSWSQRPRQRKEEQISWRHGFQPARSHIGDGLHSSAFCNDRWYRKFAGQRRDAPKSLGHLLMALPVLLLQT